MYPFGPKRLNGAYSHPSLCSCKQDAEQKIEETSDEGSAATLDTNHINEILRNTDWEPGSLINDKLGSGEPVLPGSKAISMLNLDQLNTPELADAQHVIDINHDGNFQPMLNAYQQKKSLAEGLMDLALFSANANQLRYVLQFFDRQQAYHYFAIVCISISLGLQVGVGIGLMLNSRYDVMQREGIEKADRINNWTVVGIFLVTILNVFIASFGITVAGD